MTLLKEQSLIQSLLAWYESHARTLPWRYDHHERGNPYHTWLSEIMLQQTTVATVIDYFHAFIQQWPTLKDLALANEQEVLTRWQGLGYYARARNLIRCAKIVLQDFNGVFPKDISELLSLPGIGPYTAAAISSMAFQQPTIPVDGNIIRVFSRFYAIQTPLPGLKGEVEKFVEHFPATPKPGNFAQALMDLGATICKPTKPLCDRCPLHLQCSAFNQNLHHTLPLKAPKAIKPTRYGKVLLIRDALGRILIQQRPPTGLLASMMEVPTTPWLEDPDQIEEHFFALVGERPVRPVEGIIKHTFTHFHLELEIYEGGERDLLVRSAEAIFVAPRDLKDYPLPTVFKKVLRAG